MSWESDIAKEFKQRDNKKLIGACIGTVTSATPLKASILDGQIMLDSSNTYVSNSLMTYERNVKLTTETESTTGSISINNGSWNSFKTNESGTSTGKLELKSMLKVGDLILVIPAADEQKFFIIDIVKGVK
ncbi:MAG: hypothetical protein K0S71_560 [Clostridia bacterium]|jgi:hypothetical protein|nr:hypothetical protein [Clostridia bacterium]